MEPKYKFILLDWDGCLADTLSVWMEGYKKTFAKFDLFPSEADIVNKTFGDYHGSLKLGVSQENDQKYHEMLMAEVNEGLINVKLHENVLDTLETIYNKNIKMAVVTSSKKDFIEKPIKKFGVDKFIDFILDADDVSKHKPDPEIILKAMSIFNSTHDNTLIVGDSSKDVLCSKNAGIDSALFYPKLNQRFYQREEQLGLEATYFFENFEDLLSILHIE